MRNLLFILFLITTFFACKSKPETVVGPKWTQDNSTDLNREFVHEEEIEIKVFLKQREHWDVKATGSGLRYWIYEDYNEGPNAEAYDWVDVSFQISLLDGTEVYKTENDEVSNFRVDKSDVESGIMEGIKYLSKGDRAKFIIPSHLAHGLLGDFDGIPPLEVLVVDIELVKIY